LKKKSATFARIPKKDPWCGGWKKADHLPETVWLGNSNTFIGLE
jgi:hypothetical protein